MLKYLPVNAIKMKKGQAGLPFNYLIVMIISVIVISGVFYFIIKADMPEKANELPDFEEEAEDKEIKTSDECIEYIGRLKYDQEDGFHWFYFWSGKELIKTPYYMKNNKLKADDLKWWASDYSIGEVSKEYSHPILRIYCNQDDNLMFTAVMRMLHESFYVEIAEAEGFKVCRSIPFSLVNKDNYCMKTA